MKSSPADRRLTELPNGPFLMRDWLALLAICLLAVIMRALVMTFLPSILHPDERMWLESTNWLVNHRWLQSWDFQVGTRSWLWPGLMAGFMAIGELFGAPPSSGLGGVSALICIVSLAPVICGFLWGRNVAGIPGAVTAGLLNAVWFELVYFYTHPLSEPFAASALALGLFLVYPGRGTVLSERRLFIGAAMLGLAAVVRPQLIPAVALAVIAVGGIRRRAHYPALLGGLALPIVLSGLLDWVTWGWPFHATILYIYITTRRRRQLVLRPQPGLFLPRLGMGCLGPLWRRDRALHALWRAQAAARVLGGCDHFHRPFRRCSQGVPVYLAGPAPHYDAGRRGLGDGGPTGLRTGSANRRSGGRCLSRCRSPGPSPPSLWRRRRAADGIGFDLAGRS